MLSTVTLFQQPRWITHVLFTASAKRYASDVPGS